MFLHLPLYSTTHRSQKRQILIWAPLHMPFRVLSHRLLPTWIRFPLIRHDRDWSLLDAWTTFYRDLPVGGLSSPLERSSHFPSFLDMTLLLRVFFLRDRTSGQFPVVTGLPSHLSSWAIVFPLCSFLIPSPTSSPFCSSMAAPDRFVSK